MARALSLRQGVPGFTVVTYSPTSGLLQVKNENREEVFLPEVIFTSGPDPHSLEKGLEREGRISHGVVNVS